MLTTATTATSHTANTTLPKPTAVVDGDDDDRHDEIVFVDYQDESQLADVTRLVQQDLSEPYSVFTYRYFLNRFPRLCILAVDITTGEAIGCVVCKIDVTVSSTTTSTTISLDDDGDDDDDDDEAGCDQVPIQTTVAEGEGRQQQQQQQEEVDADATAPTTPATTTTTTTAVNVNTGYIGMLAVSSSHRRRGIGKALVRQALQRMRDEYQCESVTLETEVSNQSAQRLYQDFGFIREELLVRYYLNWNDAYRLRLWFDI
jgi:peptide alpha-N-acetyltransferase